MKRKTQKVQIGRRSDGMYEFAPEGAYWLGAELGYNKFFAQFVPSEWSTLGLKAIRKGRKTTGRIVPLKNGFRIEVDPKK